MKSATRLWLFTLFDIFAIGAIYLIVYRPTIEIHAAIATQATFIKYDTRMYFCLIAVAAPLYHLIWLIDTCLPKLFSRVVYNSTFYGVLAGVVILAIGMTFKIKSDLNQNEYFYCQAASRQMTISHFGVYVRDMETCDRLGQEEADSWRNP